MTLDDIMLVPHTPNKKGPWWRDTRELLGGSDSISGVGVLPLLQGKGKGVFQNFGRPHASQSMGPVSH